MITSALCYSNEDERLRFERTRYIQILIRTEYTLELLHFILMGAVERRRKRRGGRKHKRKTVCSSNILIYMRSSSSPVSLLVTGGDTIAVLHAQYTVWMCQKCMFIYI